VAVSVGVEIVIRGVNGPAGEQLFLRADTRAFAKEIAVKLEAAVTSLTNQSLGQPRPFDATASRYELQIRERPGERPLVLTVLQNDVAGPAVAVREIIGLIARGSPGAGG
jgi:hypothetical protein